MNDFLRGIRFAARTLRKQPGFTAIAVLTLALGIGANTAIFSIVNAAFLRPLPYPNANQIYRVRRVNNRIGGGSISPAIFAQWRQRTDIFESIGVIVGAAPVTLRGGGEPVSIHAVLLSPGALSTLGVQPEVGRLFGADEENPASAHVAIISDALWKNRFGSDREMLGKTITLNTTAYGVIGVMPAGFELPLTWAKEADVWLPYALPAGSENNPSNGMTCIGRLRSNVTMANAEQALTQPLLALAQQFPNMIFPVEKATLLPMREWIRAGAGTAPLLLLGAVGFVLLIACANVANLLLARATGRQREMAIRATLGATRGQIATQLLTESTLLGLLGGIAGVLVCYASFDAVLALVPNDLPHVGAIRIDGAVLAFSLALGVLTGIVFGLAPAATMSKADLQIALKEGSSRAGASRERGRLRWILVTVEVALALVLLVGAGLLLESFGRLMTTDLGFDPHHVLTVSVPLPRSYDTAAKQIAFYDEFARKLAAVPGVQNVAYINGLPLSQGDILFSIEGRQDAENAKGDARARRASPGYFDAMRIPLVQGRLLAETDSDKSEPVAVINKSLAERLWPNGDAIGSYVWIGKPMGPGATEPAPRRIVGIAGDIHGESVAEGASFDMYTPAKQTTGSSSMQFVVRSPLSIGALQPSIQSILRAALPEQPASAVRAMDDIVAGSLTDEKFHATLLGLFGGLGLLIVTVGVYGVVSYFVAQRTHEFGVRMALGATQSDVLGMVLKQGLAMAAAGVVVGIAAAMALTRLLASMLYEVKPNDPLTIVVASAVMIGVTIAACWIPARRATRVDPLVALRYE
ncbi:MAG TPA: ABC transporter permease [Candidatus Acidoferrales bacterium]|nr:ABC transporter permease [Candidatus Acidoferrales bacterium]